MPEPPAKDRLGRFILSRYIPSGIRYGFHFAAKGDTIFTPVIRRQVREQAISDEGHYTVYLPSYDDDRLIKRLSAFDTTKWDVFSKHNKKHTVVDNVTIHPINSEAFTKSMATSSGVLCGAGFETPAEALFLGKKLLVIPMKNQYEQHLNAAALKAMKVPVMPNFKPKHANIMLDWLDKNDRIFVNYPDNTQQIIDGIVQKHGPVQQ
ncbi:MAG: hypothetical protein EOP48_18435 [Sphingobacteriales bacterium]|nr:MAG: hypothetical protein EOP48_18435 [Sphingobacteriales bacterium]